MKLQVVLALLPLTLAAPAPLAPRDGTPIPGKYIVKLKSTSTKGQTIPQIISGVLDQVKAEAQHTYNIGNFAGFAASMSDATVKAVRKLPNVESVEPDVVINADLGHIDEIIKRAPVTQSSTSSIWGLGRISSKATNSGKYVYDSTAGAGTCAYVIDTGIDTTHPEFEGRATFLANFAGDGNNADGNGHGTHVAGTIGSKTYGVSKRAKLFAVKVLKADGSGALSGVLAGINYAANDAKKRNCKGAVANLSLGGGKSDSLNSAARNAVSAGLFLAVAAGNSAVDASGASPASEPTVFTVGATDSSDKWATFSNFGSSVDILAPGVAILSTWKSGGTAVLSGTSMATPHVAGLAAYLLALEGKKAPAALSSRIVSLGNQNAITNVPAGTVNLLAFNGNKAA
ncbi:subtilisin-like protein [Plenodomus tracheiphilus IPT5]|uniref:Subtilisin-like protein n=1 Tax=Plenodomus tracheiphilus IPT5 TaxID=1408161 RepID=A0A6A7B4I8_9PLEO|nr:subtilisin-like protein [Plenodomus tracheiphilus IPT5]